MANSRDFTGKNRKFTGTKGITVSKGTTGERVGSESGEFRFNTTTSLMEYFDGVQWKSIDAPPTISSVTTNDATGSATDLNSDGSTIYTVTINGGNFATSLNVQFIGNTGTLYTAGNINRVSLSQITCTTLSSMSATDDPYAVKVTNTAANLFATLENALTFNAPPVFVNAAGLLGEIANGETISSSTLDASATDAEGNTITYTLISGNFPGSGLSLSSSTGYITGTLSGAPSLGNYPFTIRASTAEGFVERQFHIAVINPYVVATGGTETTEGNFKIHTFTGPGTFTVTNAGKPVGPNAVDYLVVAGGGSGFVASATGGGGAGGFRLSNATGMPAPNTSPLANPTGLTLPAAAYPITVGAGGAGGNPANAGAPSVFSTITSAGGGYPSTNNNAGNSGGSGGGGIGGQAPGLSNPMAGGAGNTPPVSPPQGNNGGRGYDGQVINTQGGGGGGAGAVGGNAGPQAGAPGGVGSYVLATGFAGVNGTTGPVPGVRYFSGGGGGGTDTPGSNSYPAVAGGGGQGGSGNTAGGANTGGGSGGGPSSVAGGSGIVIIRYKYQ